MSAPHGFDDDPETRRLLRSRPPAAALAWVETVLGGRVVRVRALRGGTSSAVHQVTVTGRPEPAVLRRYVRPEMNAEEPDTADRESRALRFVERLSLPTPHLLAVDADGSASGVPTVLMSRLPGRVEWSPSDMDRWLRLMAELLPVIHAAALPPPGQIQAYATYRQRRYDPPAWARRPAIWVRAVDLVRAGPPAGRDVFVHRDFHPGNVLWWRGRVSGVVDWQAASIGPAGVDVGHCRANLMRYGMPVVEKFTDLWERISGQRYDPWADLATLVGNLDGLHEDPPRDRDRVERMVARAVAELRATPS